MSRPSQAELECWAELAPLGLGRCRSCGEDKPFKLFAKARGGAMRRTCQACVNSRSAANDRARREDPEYRKRYNAYSARKRAELRAKNPEEHSRKVRGWELQRKYGLSPAEFNHMLAEQDGRCAICMTPKPGAKGWCVDHDHTTGAVRGILCSPCNLGLGSFRDNPLALEMAIIYLRPRESAEPTDKES